MELLNQGAVGIAKAEIVLEIKFAGKVLGQEQIYKLRRTYVLNPTGKPLKSVNLNMNGNVFVYGTMTSPKERIRANQEKGYATATTVLKKLINSNSVYSVGFAVVQRG